MKLHANRSGRVLCMMRGVGTHDCAGRLEAHHVIREQDLRRERGKMLVSAHRFALDDPRRKLAEIELDDLIADPRNSAIVCSLGHAEVHRGAPLPRLPHAKDFAAEYGLEHLLPEPRIRGRKR